MAFDVTRYKSPDGDTAVRLTIAGELERTKPFYTYVPEGAEFLVLTITRPGSYGHLEGPVGVRSYVTGPHEDLPRDQEFVRDEQGRLIFVREHPQPGRWHISLEQQDAEVEAEINAVSLLPDWKSRAGRFGGWLRCRGCKFSLRAVLISLLAAIASPVAAGASVAEILDSVPAEMHSLLESLVGKVDSRLLFFLSFVIDCINEPIDRLVEKVCIWLGLCIA